MRYNFKSVKNRIVNPFLKHHLQSHLLLITLCYKQKLKLHERQSMKIA